MDPAVVVFALAGVIAFGLGFVAALVTRRYRVTLVVGLAVLVVLYLLYVLTVGEGAPFVPYVMAWGAVGGAVLLAGSILGISAAGFVDRKARPF